MGEFESDTDPDASQGFGDVTTYEPEKPSPLSWDGYVKLSSGYNFSHKKPETGETDYRGLSKLRGELQLELNMRFSQNWQGLISGKGTYDGAYQLNGKKDYTEEVLNEYEDEGELREAYVIGRLTNSLDIKAGRQIVVWGKSDTIRITDVLNPLDLREPGLTDLEDLRLPVFMTKLDYYFGNWNLSGIAIHEIRFDKQPAFGSDFYPYTTPLPPEEKLSDGGDNTEYGIALKGIFSGWDLSFFYAHIFWDTPHATLVTASLSPELLLSHPRVHMMGSAVNVAIGNWIVKGEAAYIDGLEFFNEPDESYCRIDAMMGLEYYGFDDAVVIFEIADRRINGFDSMLKQSPDQAQKKSSQMVLHLSKTFLNETLELEGLFSFFGLDGKDGRIQRLAAIYDISDAVEIKGGILLYQSGDLPEFAHIGDNDRVFAEIKYSF